MKPALMAGFARGFYEGVLFSFLTASTSPSRLHISCEHGPGNQTWDGYSLRFLSAMPVSIFRPVFFRPASGRALFLLFGVLCWGIATALTAVLPSGIPGALIFLIAVRGALGVGESVIYPAANQFVASVVPKEERVIVNGLIFAGVGAGSGLTPSSNQRAAKEDIYVRRPRF
jgi:MFS transporter, ACS family, glucarate transporter